MIVREWHQGDNEKLLLQPGQEYMATWMKDVDLSSVEHVWVAEDDAGDIIVIGGLIPIWENRAFLWSLISAHAGKEMLRIHKEVRRRLQDFNKQYRRIEITVDAGFTQGHRWAKMLGFEIEGYMKAYRPDGGDMVMYSRIRDE